MRGMAMRDPGPGLAGRSEHEVTSWRVRLSAPAEDAPDCGDFLVAGIPATVPGAIHDDLVAAGVLGHHDVGLAEEHQHWVGRSTWTWQGVVEVDTGDHDRWELELGGIDTLGEVAVNGTHVASTANMHRTHTVDVTGLLEPGTNTVEVTIRSIFEEVDRVRDEVGFLPATDAVHYPYVRKMACNFGWDWGPVLVTAGLWRPVVVRGWSVARLHDVSVLTDLDGDDGVATVSTRVERDDHGGDGDGDARPELALRVRVDGEEATTTVERNQATSRLTVPSPAKWWPVGMGDQPRSLVTVALLADGVVVERLERRVGFRHVSVVEADDDQGRRWAIQVNGRPVAVRGFNWIPDRPFPGGIEPGRVARRIDQAVDANANLLRVWGGGIFESREFYDHCDERGVLVWQDFLFACAAYPETATYRAEVEAEAREAIVARSHHPALVLFCGNNECVWGWHDWGWQAVLGDRPWGAGHYVDLLPGLVAELDPTRPYLPASPWSGSLDAPPDDDAVGVSHVWDVWNELDWVHYRDRTPPFVAEMGWCGPPTWATLRRAVPDGLLDLSNPAVVHRVRALDGVAKLERGLADHYGDLVDDLGDDDWLLLAQVNQARALACGVDHLRALQRCSGVVVWQLNDCWPVISWAAIDGDERRKPLWYALRDAFAPRRVTVRPCDDGGLELVACNDTDERWEVEVAVRRVGLDGSAHAGLALRLTVAPDARAVRALPSQVAEPDDPANEVLMVDAAGQRSTWTWAEDPDLALPRADYTAEVEVLGDGLAVTVTARSFLRSLSLFPDRLLVDGEPLPASAVVDDLLVDLLPGESHRFHVTGARPDHVEAVTTPPVLRAVNDIAALQRV